MRVSHAGERREAAAEECCGAAAERGAAHGGRGAAGPSLQSRGPALRRSAGCLRGAHHRVVSVRRARTHTHTHRPARGAVTLLSAVLCAPQAARSAGGEARRSHPEVRAQPARAGGKDG